MGRCGRLSLGLVVQAGNRHAMTHHGQHAWRIPNLDCISGVNDEIRITGRSSFHSLGRRRGRLGYRLGILTGRRWRLLGSHADDARWGLRCRS